MSEQKAKQHPQVIIVFKPNGVECKWWGAEKMSLVQLERAAFKMMSDAQKARARLSHMNPAKREAGYSNPKEKGVSNVA